MPLAQPSSATGAGRAGGRRHPSAGALSPRRRWRRRPATRPRPAPPTGHVTGRPARPRTGPAATATDTVPSTAPRGRRRTVAASLPLPPPPRPPPPRPALTGACGSAAAGCDDLEDVGSASGDGAIDVEVTAVTRIRRRGPGAPVLLRAWRRAVDGHDFAPAVVGRGIGPAVRAAPRPRRGPGRGVVGRAGPSGRWRTPSSVILASLTVVGVTGTNGKTTTCASAAGHLRSDGWAAGDHRHPHPGTRPRPRRPTSRLRLAGWRDGGVDAVAMEVSSHALVQHRVDASRFAAAVFTNLTPEHLDYHRTMDEYFEAKARLFEPGRAGVAVVNRDDQWGRRLLDDAGGRCPRWRLRASRTRPTSCSAPGGSRFTLGGSAHRPSTSAAGSTWPTRWPRPPVPAPRASTRPSSPTGWPRSPGARGRFEPVDAGQPFTVLVDYAHTPDGLDPGRSRAPGSSPAAASSSSSAPAATAITTSGR